MRQTSVADRLAVSIVVVSVSRAGCGPTRVDMKFVGFQNPGRGGEEVQIGPVGT